MLLHIWESLKEILFISVSTLYLGEKKKQTEKVAHSPLLSSVKNQGKIK